MHAFLPTISDGKPLIAVFRSNQLSGRDGHQMFRSPASYPRSLSAVKGDKCRQKFSRSTEKNIMKRCMGLLIASLFFAAPMLPAQEHSDHIEVGAFADYFRFGQTSPVRNFIGVGGRAAFNVHRDVQLEAEMAYDFKRTITSTYTNGVTNQTFTSRFR